MLLLGLLLLPRFTNIEWALSGAAWYGWNNRSLLPPPPPPELPLLCPPNPPPLLLVGSPYGVFVLLLSLLLENVRPTAFSRSSSEKKKGRGVVAPPLSPMIMSELGDSVERRRLSLSLLSVRRTC